MGKHSIGHVGAHFTLAQEKIIHTLILILMQKADQQQPKPNGKKRVLMKNVDVKKRRQSKKNP